MGIRDSVLFYLGRRYPNIWIARPHLRRANRTLDLAVPSPAIWPAPESPGNLAVAGIKISVFGWLFYGLLLLNVPRLARREEEAFRLHVRSCPEAIFQSIKFGFMHCIVGVPLSFGLALAIPGMVFAYAYSKGGTRLSTAWHSVYNYIVLGLAGVYLASLM